MVSCVGNFTLLMGTSVQPVLRRLHTLIFRASLPHRAKLQGQSSDYNLSNNLTISYNWKQQQQHLWCPEIIFHVSQRGWHDKDICIQPALFWHLNAALWVPVHLHLWALRKEQNKQNKSVYLFRAASWRTAGNIWMFSASRGRLPAQP